MIFLVYPVLVYLIYILIRFLLLWLLIFLGSMLLGCTPIHLSLLESRNKILTIAEEKHFVRENIQTPYFKLMTLSKISSQADPFIIYLEGDGYSSLALQLALLDPRPNVVYIARPEYDSKYGSTHRFSPEVIEATNLAIDHFTKSTKRTPILLIGFSGGGGLAVLVAAHRKGVQGIITIAGDLNHVAMSKHHATSPLTHSLNPINFANKLKHIPQIHFVGKRDRVVPLSIAKGYLRASGENKAVKITVVEAAHKKGWLEKWPILLLQSPFDGRQHPS